MHPAVRALLAVASGGVIDSACMPHAYSLVFIERYSNRER